MQEIVYLDDKILNLLDQNRQTHRPCLLLGSTEEKIIIVPITSQPPKKGHREKIQLNSVNWINLPLEIRYINKKLYQESERAFEHYDGKAIATIKKLSGLR